MPAVVVLYSLSGHLLLEPKCQKDIHICICFVVAVMARPLSLKPVPRRLLLTVKCCAMGDTLSDQD